MRKREEERVGREGKSKHKGKTKMGEQRKGRADRMES